MAEVETPGAVAAPEAPDPPVRKWGRKNSTSSAGATPVVDVPEAGREPSHAAHLSPGLAAPAPPTTPQQVVVVSNEDAAKRFLRDKGLVNVPLEHFDPSSQGGLPVIPGKFITQTISGREYTRPATIQDINAHLVYCWLAERDLRSDPNFQRGYYPVTPGNEGGRGIPASAWPPPSEDQFITMGENVLCFCTRTFASDQKRGPRDMAARRAGSAASTMQQADVPSAQVSTQMSVDQFSAVDEAAETMKGA